MTLFCAVEAMRIDPTSTTPWIEFAPDIIGRVECRRDLRDDLEADEKREHEETQRGQEFGAHFAAPFVVAGTIIAAITSSSGSITI